MTSHDIRVSDAFWHRLLHPENAHCCISTTVVVVFGLLASLLLWRLWRFTIAPLLHPNEARELPYWIPFLGHAIPFFMNSDSTFTRGMEYFQNSREPFGITVAGSRLYILTAAADALATSKNTKELVFADYIKDMMVSMGCTPMGVTKMWQPRLPFTKVSEANMRYPNRLGKPLGNLSEEIFRKQLHQGNLSVELQATLLDNIHKSLTWKALSLPGKVVLSSYMGERTVSLMRWTQDALLAGATGAFFGGALLDRNPGLLDSFSDFDEDSWQITYKIPRPWSNKMHAAKQKLIDALTSYFESPVQERPGACWLILTMETEMRAAEMQESDMAASLLMVYWVINANAWKVCFWIMAHLVQDPALYNTIRNEVAPIVAANQSPNDLSDSLDHCPRLLAVYQEALRTVTSSISVRNVAHPLEIGGKLVSPGERILIPYRQILMDEAVFGPDAKSFNPVRFLNNKSLAKNPSFKPFGSGITHCPGRFLAQKEVLTFIGLALSRFDVYKATESRFPRLELKKPTLGIMGPVNGDDVIVTVRPFDL